MTQLYRLCTHLTSGTWLPWTGCCLLMRPSHIEATSPCSCTSVLDLHEMILKDCWRGQCVSSPLCFHLLLTGVHCPLSPFLAEVGWRRSRCEGSVCTVELHWVRRSGSFEELQWRRTNGSWPLHLAVRDSFWLTVKKTSPSTAQLQNYIILWFVDYIQGMLRRNRHTAVIIFIPGWIYWPVAPCWNI